MYLYLYIFVYAPSAKSPEPSLNSPVTFPKPSIILSYAPPTCSSQREFI